MRAVRFTGPVPAAAACCMLLAACATTRLPLLFDFTGSPSPGVIAGLDPGQFRAALKLPQPARPKPFSARLGIRLDPRAGGAAVLSRSLPLREVPGPTPGLPAPGPGYRWFVYDLPSDGVTALRELQATMGGEAEASSRWRDSKMNVSAVYENVTPGSSLTLDVWMQVDAGEGFFALARGEHVTIPRPGTA